MNVGRLFADSRSRLAGSVGAQAHSVALVALYALALSVDLSTAGFNLAMVLIALATIPVLPTLWREFSRLSVFWVMVVLTAYVIIQSSVMASYHPIMHESSNPHWSHVARVTGLISLILGWWLVQHRRHIPWLLAAVCFSLFLNRLLAMDLPGVLDDPFASRGLWGDAAVRVGFASASGAVICLATMVYIISLPVDGERTWLRRYGLVLSGVGLAAFLLALYGSQTRGAWIGMLATSGFLMAVVLVRLVQRGRGYVAGTAGLLALACFIGVMVTLLDRGKVLETRVTGETEAIVAIANLDREALYDANRSMGRRVNMWTEALLAVQERPLFGHGVGTKPLLEQRSQLDIGGGTGHLHNVYLELAYGLGLLGLIAFAVVYFSVLRGFVEAWRRQSLPDVVGLVVGSFWIMTFVTLLTDVRIGHSSSRALLILMLGLACYGLLMRNGSIEQRPTRD